MATFTPPTIHSGKWGNVTSTLDWCEANYQFSYHVAEVVNAYSNLLFIGLAMLGMYHIQSQSLPTRYLIAYIGFAIVGIGSFFFHSTLWIEAQLADELPMIYLVGHTLFLLLDKEHGFNLSLKSVRILSIETLLALGFTWSYCNIIRSPVYHQIVFTALIMANTIQATKRYSEMKGKLPPHFKDFIIRNILTGGFLFLFGFLIWNLDNNFCGPLTSWKVAIGWPAAFLLEGHGWWHLLSGLGTYLMFVGLHLITLCVKDDHRGYTTASLFGLPYIKRAASFKEL